MFWRGTETHTWVTDKTGMQQLICFVGITMSQEALCLCVRVCAHTCACHPVCVCLHLSVPMSGCLNVCVCVCVCRWQLQPQTDWHLAVAVVLTAELTALIRTHPNQKETTPVHCSWAQPGKRRGREGGREGERSMNGGREWKRWRGEWLEAGGECDRGQRKVGGEGGRE